MIQFYYFPIWRKSNNTIKYFICVWGNIPIISHPNYLHKTINIKLVSSIFITGKLLIQYFNNMRYFATLY